MKFVTGEIGKLEYLNINFNSLLTISTSLTEDELSTLMKLYEELCRTVETIRPELQKAIHILEVPINLSLDFDTHGFNLKLIDLHCWHLAITDLWQTCPSVTTVDYPDVCRLYRDYAFRPLPHKSQPPANVHLGFWRFSQLYPNIQTVFLKVSNRKTAEPELFLSFLRSCNGLTRLRFGFVGFKSEFYDQIAELPSLTELRSLTLIEEADCYHERIRFDNLLQSFQHLDNLTTNLATRDVMFDLVSKMPAKARFDFGFWSESDYEMYRFEFKSGWHPTSTPLKRRLEVFPTHLPDEPRVVLFRNIVDIAYLQEEFDKSKLREWSAHWLESSD